MEKPDINQSPTAFIEPSSCGFTVLASAISHHCKANLWMNFTQPTLAFGRHKLVNLTNFRKDTEGLPAGSQTVPGQRVES